MAPMDINLFKGHSDITASEFVRLAAENSENDVANVLKDFKWNGNKIIGSVILHLSEDNCRVDGGNFQARGSFPQKEVKMKAASIWPGTEGRVTLTIKLPKVDIFKFDDSLASEYVPSEEIAHSFSAVEDGEIIPILAAEREEWRVGDFCLRLVCHITKATAKSGVTLKYTLLIFPGQRESIMDVSELAQSASWPGMKVTEGELPLCPMPQKIWQCPILPVLVTSNTFEQEPGPPPADELRRAIAAIMCRAAAPEVCKSRTEMMNKWQRYANNPDEFVAKPGPLSWPTPTAAATTAGKINRDRDL